MTRTIVAYTLNAVLLFGALFATFVMAGLGRVDRGNADEAVADIPVEASATVEEPEDEPTPSPLAPDLDYPDLEWGPRHRISHRTRIFSEPTSDAARTQYIPENGYFVVDGSEQVDGELWYSVTVNDGIRDYAMYLPAEDLNWKTVTPIYTRAEREARRAEQSRVDVEKLLREVFGNRVARNPEPAPPPPPPEPSGFQAEWRDFVQSLGDTRTANLLVSGGAALILTLLVMGAFAALSYLQKGHGWETLPDPSEHRSSDSGEFYDYEPPRGPGPEDGDPDDPFS